MRECWRYASLFSFVLIGQANLLGFSGLNSYAAEPSSWAKAFSAGESELANENLVEAEESFRKALREVEQIPSDVADEAKCMNRLADALALQNKTLEAQALYRRSLALLEKRYGKDSPKVIPALFALGSLSQSEGDSSTSMALYQRALRINERNYGPYSPAVAQNLRRLGRASFRAARRDDAARHYKRALSILMQQPGLAASKQMQGLLSDYQDLISGNDTSRKDLIADFRQDMIGHSSIPDLSASAATATTPQPAPLQAVAGDASDISTTEAQEGSPRLRPAHVAAGTVVSQDKVNTAAEAADKQELANPSARPELTLSPTTDESFQPGVSSWERENSFQLKAKQQAQSNEDPLVLRRGFGKPFSESDLAPAYAAMDDVIYKQGHFKESETLLQRKIAIDLKALGPGHPAVANDLNALALLYVSQQRYKEAEPILMRALKIYEEAYGADNLLAVKARTVLASVEYYLGNVEQAAQLYRAALSSGLETSSPRDLQTARILNELAFLYYQQGKLQEASTFYQWALASTEGAVGENSPLLGACMKDYAQVLKATGHANEAAEMEGRADAMLAQK
jgi:tetratricopeptide (TPR) repeat protein